MWKRTATGTANPPAGQTAGGQLTWGKLLASGPEVWHWLLYIGLALLALLAIAGRLRG